VVLASASAHSNGLGASYLDGQGKPQKSTSLPILTSPNPGDHEARSDIRATAIPASHVCANYNGAASFRNPAKP
jgi:hypothetical protein